MERVPLCLMQLEFLQTSIDSLEVLVDGFEFVHETKQT